MVVGMLAYAGVAVCLLAPNLGVLLLGRALQGVRGAGRS